jgi:cytochrome b6-f complex iron-sulfur subunit
MNKTRREFLSDSATLAIACCGVGIASMLEGCTSAKYVSSVKEGNNLIVNLVDFGEETFAIVQNSDLPAPLYVSITVDGKYQALLMSCTHKGCKVKAKGPVFKCPCHGSEFSMEGAVLKGPATTDLTEFPAYAENDKVLIQIN